MDLYPGRGFISKSFALHDFPFLFSSLDTRNQHNVSFDLLLDEDDINSSLVRRRGGIKKKKKRKQEK